MAFARKFLPTALKVTAFPRLNFWGIPPHRSLNLNASVYPGYLEVKKDCLDYVVAHGQETLNNGVIKKGDPVESNINLLTNTLVEQMKKCMIDSELVSVLSKPEFQQGSLASIVETCLGKISARGVAVGKKFKS